MQEKLRKILDRICDWTELLLAVIVVLCMLCGIVFFLINLFDTSTPVPDSDSFLRFLRNIFNFVVGIEFTKMLLKPSVERVIEVLVFLVTRHLILHSSGAWEILASILGIILLYGGHFAIRFLSRRSGTSVNAQSEEEKSCCRSGRE